MSLNNQPKLIYVTPAIFTDANLEERIWKNKQKTTNGLTKHEKVFILNEWYIHFNEIIEILHDGNQTCYPRVILPEVMSPKTWVRLPEIFSFVTQKKESNHPKKQILKISEFQCMFE